MADHKTTANKCGRHVIVEEGNGLQVNWTGGLTQETLNSDEGELTYQAFNMEGGWFFFSVHRTCFRLSPNI